MATTMLTLARMHLRRSLFAGHTRNTASFTTRREFGSTATRKNETQNNTKEETTTETLDASQNPKEVRVRYAPSPTGGLHLGGLRTALFNFLFAKRSNGSFLLRIEDTDQTRKVEGSVEQIKKDLRWCGIDFPDPLVQSTRTEIYREHAHRLLHEGKAYRCFCTSERLTRQREGAQQAGKTPMYDRHCLRLTEQQIQENLKNNIPFTIRMKVEKQKQIELQDVVHGKVSFNTNFVDDQILLKSDGFPTYHLASVVDDHLSGISHVIRGEEWLSSVPKHIQLYQDFGWEVPRFAHLPLLLNPDKTKLSKRQGAVHVGHYRDLGYEPEAVTNFVALLGWTPSDASKEVMSLDELTNEFQLSDLNHAGAIVNLEKLNWFNSVFLKIKLEKQPDVMVQRYRESLKELYPTENFHSLDSAFLKEALSLSIPRALMFHDCAKDTMYFRAPDLNSEEAVALKTEIFNTNSLRILDELKKALESLGQEQWTKEEIDKASKIITKSNKLPAKEIKMLARYLMTGKHSGPGVTDLMVLIGRQSTLSRLYSALEHLSSSQV